MKKKIISLVLSFIIVSLCASPNAFAVLEECPHGRRTFNDMKLAGGVGNYGNNDRYYWIDSTFNENYITRIQNAFKYWVNTTTTPGVTTPISIVQTTQQSASTFDIHNEDLPLTVSGMTKFYSVSTEVDDPSAQNWTWNMILIDQSFTLSYPNRQKVGLVAHEVGHAMGLSHQPNNQYDSIMYNYDNGRVLEDGTYRNRPSKRDCNNINHIY